MAFKSNKHIFQNRETGTAALTLVELLIYVAIFAIVAGLFVGILTTTVQSNNQEVAANEVTGQLNFVLSTVQRLVQNSSQVEVYASLAQSTSTNATTTGSFLKIRTNSTSTDPTCVYLSNGTVWETTGATPNASSTCNLSNAVALTTSKVVANSLDFNQYNIPGGHTSVQLNAELTYNSTNPQFEITRALQSAIGRVSAATFDSDLLPNQNNTFNVGSLTNSQEWANGYFAGVSLYNAVSAGADDYMLTLQNTTTAVDSRAGIRFWVNNGGNAGAAIKVSNDGSTGGNISFITNSSGTDTTRIFIQASSGDIGIGTVSPARTLDVNGVIASVGGIDNRATNYAWTGSYSHESKVIQQSILVSNSSTGTNINLNGQFVGLLEIYVTWFGDTGTPEKHAEITANVTTNSCCGDEVLSDIQLINIDGASGTYYGWSTAPAVAVYAPNNSSAPAVVVEGSIGSSNDYLARTMVTVRLIGDERANSRLSLSTPGGAPLSTSWLTSPVLNVVGGEAGIGIVSPSEALDVNGVGRFRQSGGNGSGPIEISDRLSSDTQSINFNIYNKPSWTYRNSDYGGSIGFDSSGNFVFYTVSSGTAGGAVTFSTNPQFEISNGGTVGFSNWTADPWNYWTTNLLPNATPNNWYVADIENSTGYPSAYGNLLGFTNSSNGYGYSFQMFKGSTPGGALAVRFATAATTWSNWQYIGPDGSGNVSVAGNLSVTGSITAGTKDFKITDPLNANDWLYHGSLEGPENGVIYHGEGQLKNGTATITLPDYFEALTMKTDRTVQLTPEFGSISDPVSELAAGPVVNGQFMVKAIDKNNPSQKFSWQVQAARSDVPPLQVVQPKN